MVAEILTGVNDEVSQVLLVPCLAGLFFLALLSVVLWGDMLCEFFMDKRYQKRNGTQLLLSRPDAGAAGDSDPAGAGDRCSGPGRHGHAVQLHLVRMKTSLGKGKSLLWTRTLFWEKRSFPSLRRC